MIIHATLKSIAIDSIPIRAVVVDTPIAMVVIPVAIIVPIMSRCS